ncbi:MAG: STAS domain-containing protein [Chitinophagales bacterium]
MELKKEIKNGVVVIYLSGNLLGENANGPVLEYLKENLDGGNKRIIFNLKELKFINSTGLGMLMTALARTRNAGGEMILSDLPDIMKKLLKMMKLDSTFVVADSEEAALLQLA